MGEMPEPKDKRIASWPKRKRIEEAARKVIYEHWSRVKAAEYYGVSRQSVITECQKLQPVYDARLEQARAAERPRSSFVEERDVGTFLEFDEKYFGQWQCPDCLKHHDRPDHHTEIAEALASDASRILVNMPPFHAKSTWITVKWVVYQICKNPNIRIVIVSKSLSFAETFLVSIKELLTVHELYEGGPDLIDDFGPFRDPDNRNQIWSGQQIYVAGRVSAEKDPTVRVLGVEGQIYGRRADIIVFDDVATVENQRNPERVLRMLEWIDKEAISRIGKRGKIVFVGTRVHAGDIYSFLGKRPTYKVIRYPLIKDDEHELVLWPDHFPYDRAVIVREEMSPADFQLVYQNVDVPGLGASFTAEMMDACKDRERVLGHFDPHWRLVAGLDPAGGTKDSGYTAMVLRAIDLSTGKRFLVDISFVKSMKAPALKEKMLEWSTIYPIYEWRVESNGLQSQIVQYDRELVARLAQMGSRVVPHITGGGNKWDPQFGVESGAPLFASELVSIPWGNAPTAQAFQPLTEQYILFPMGTVSDAVMADWFAEIGCRELMRRAHLPYFNSRQRVPPHVRRRRRIVDFASGEVRNVSLQEQNGGWHGPGIRGYRRLMVGQPGPHSELQQPEPDTGAPGFVNVPQGHDGRPPA